MGYTEQQCQLGYPAGRHWEALTLFDQDQFYFLGEVLSTLFQKEFHLCFLTITELSIKDLILLENWTAFCLQKIENLIMVLFLFLFLSHNLLVQSGASFWQNNSLKHLLAPIYLIPVSSVCQQLILFFFGYTFF